MGIEDQFLGGGEDRLIEQNTGATRIKWDGLS
jgi:hypothetical protein